MISFRQHERYIIIEADKNLGPCILEQETYIRRTLEEHLDNASNYNQITKTFKLYRNNMRCRNYW